MRCGDHSSHAIWRIGSDSLRVADNCWRRIRKSINQTINHSTKLQTCSCVSRTCSSYAGGPGDKHRAVSQLVRLPLLSIVCVAASCNKLHYGYDCAAGICSTWSHLIVIRAQRTTFHFNLVCITVTLGKSFEYDSEYSCC